MTIKKYQPGFFCYRTISVLKVSAFQPDQLNNEIISREGISFFDKNFEERDKSDCYKRFNANEK